ncbi:DUF2190 family protein [Sphingomonas sp. YL-JM2C]
MKNYKQEGDKLRLIAPAGGVVSGVGVLIGALFVVAENTVAEGLPFSGVRRGVVELAAATHATTQGLAVGDVAYWDAGNKRVTKTATGNTAVGVVTVDKASTAATCWIVLVPRLAAAGAAIADLAGGADLPTTVTKVNDIIAALEAAGIIKA